MYWWKWSCNLVVTTCIITPALAQPGEKAAVPIKQLHRFYNPGKEVIRFRVKLVPPKDNFLKGLSIGYGLAADGLTSKSGIPKKLSLLNPIIRSSARRVRKRGSTKRCLKNITKPVVRNLLTE